MVAHSDAASLPGPRAGQGPAVPVRCECRPTSSLSNGGPRGTRGEMPPWQPPSPTCPDLSNLCPNIQVSLSCDIRPENCNAVSVPVRRRPWSGCPRTAVTPTSPSTRPSCCWLASTAFPAGPDCTDRSPRSGLGPGIRPSRRQRSRSPTDCSASPVWITAPTRPSGSGPRPNWRPAFVSRALRLHRPRLQNRTVGRPCSI